MARLSCVFRDIGYEGASIAVLAEATGLKKASLYHRFPRGKQQMAEEVLAAALTWYGSKILTPLRSNALPAERLALVAEHLNAFYEGGRRACLLNMLASTGYEIGPFSPAIKSAFEALVAGFAELARDAGCDTKTANYRAERVVMLLHGSLVMSRGLQSPQPFKSFMSSLATELLGPATSPSIEPRARRR